ncbi:uncharacterized protein DS421_13g439050 [Arachis hypogaea]|nr:uncharacterized protein DS421_13g439050 [Arachis hypogaea]
MLAFGWDKEECFVLSNKLEKMILPSESCVATGDLAHAAAFRGQIYRLLRKGFDRLKNDLFFSCLNQKKIVFSLEICLGL